MVEYASKSNGDLLNNPPMVFVHKFFSRILKDIIMRTTHVYLLAIITVFSYTMWGCAQSKSEPSVQNTDSIANAQAEQNRKLAAATADSVSKAAEAAKLALDEKIEEVAESIKKAYPYAYDLKPVDKEPTTDMTSLKNAIVYPKAAKDRNIEGRVYVRALVGTNGRIINSPYAARF